MNVIQPSIAQLVERWTVVVLWQISIGRWFKSGSKEFCIFKKNILNEFNYCHQLNTFLFNCAYITFNILSI